MSPGEKTPATNPSEPPSIAEELASAAALLPSASSPGAQNAPRPPPSNHAAWSERPSADETRRALARAGSALPTAFAPDATATANAPRPINPEDLIAKGPAGDRIHDDGEDFWSAIPSMLLHPLGGSGLAWVFFLGLMVMVPLLVSLPTFLFQQLGGVIGIIVGLILGLFGVFAAAAVVGGLARFFHYCVHASVVGRSVDHFSVSHAIAPGPGFALLAVLVVGIIPSRALQMLVGGLAGDILGGFALIPLALWWPAALFEVTKANEPFRGFELEAIRRGLDLAPREALAIVGVGLVALLLAWTAWMLAGFLPFAQTPVGRFALFVTAMMPIGYAHGVMGALYGRLIRDVPAIGAPEYELLD